MNKISVISIGLLFLSACATQVPIAENKDSTPLHYEFEWNHCGAKPCLHERLTFEMSQSQETLKLPKEVIGMKDLYKVIQNLKVTSQSGSLSSTADPAEFTVHGARGKIVQIECDIIQDFEGDPSANERYYRPLIDENRFEIFGEGLFIYPAWDKNKTREVTLQFNLPGDFQSITSFGEDTHNQTVQTTIELMRQGTYVGGKGVRLKHFEIKGQPVWVAFMGEFGVKDDEFTDILEKVLKTERNFWQDHHFPFYFVSAISVSNDDAGGGQGRLNGFSVFGTRYRNLDWLKHLLAHELFHTWTGHTILKQEPEERIYWFMEGFTDYYANILSFRGGLISFQDAFKTINKVIKSYYISGARNAPLDRVEADFWKNYEVEKLPYQQGFLLAQAWNDEIKSKSQGKQSLDDFMLAMLKEARLHKTVASIESVEKTIEPFLKREAAHDIDRWIVTGGTIPVFPQVLYRCAKLEEVETEKFNIGFDRNATRQTKVFTKVDQAGPAYAAGLREGDEWKGMSIYSGNFSKPVELDVMQNGKLVHLNYLPRGDKVKIPQYVLRPHCSSKTM